MKPAHVDPFATYKSEFFAANLAFGAGSILLERLD